MKDNDIQSAVPVAEKDIPTLLEGQHIQMPISIKVIIILIEGQHVQMPIGNKVIIALVEGLNLKTTDDFSMIFKTQIYNYCILSWLNFGTDLHWNNDTSWGHFECK